MASQYQSLFALLIHLIFPTRIASLLENNKALVCCCFFKIFGKNHGYIEQSKKRANDTGKALALLFIAVCDKAENQ